MRYVLLINTMYCTEEINRFTISNSISWSQRLCNQPKYPFYHTDKVWPYSIRKFGAKRTWGVRTEWEREAQRVKMRLRRKIMILKHTGIKSHFGHTVRPSLTLSHVQTSSFRNRFLQKKKHTSTPRTIACTANAGSQLPFQCLCLVGLRQLYRVSSCLALPYLTLP